MVGSAGSSEAARDLGPGAKAETGERFGGVGQRDKVWVRQFF